MPKEITPTALPATENGSDMAELENRYKQRTVVMDIERPILNQRWTVVLPTAAWSRTATWQALERGCGWVVPAQWLNCGSNKSGLES